MDGRADGAERRAVGPTKRKVADGRREEEGFVSIDVEDDEDVCGQRHSYTFPCTVSLSVIIFPWNFEWENRSDSDGCFLRLTSRLPHDMCSSLYCAAAAAFLDMIDR